MRTAEVLRIFDSIGLDVSDDCVIERGKRRDAAFLHLSVSDRPGRWAVVSSPGDRWFSLEVDGGFSLDHFEEDTPDADVVRILRNYATLGLQYLREFPDATSDGLLRASVIRISAGDGEAVLRRSVAGNLKSLIGFGRRR